eukprot:CAMPEP_0176145422 /NCGR_PEP_ID=MMETSP0120_2-20121206/74073_1 /TAXON_ID=160619 /ORGANISM="Kryptoperidinium foliaceum, Strain CCMP 1326" /LENGTH=37 /DNA_ID=CAMNT_0017481879 /DNA_START=143 /DNA_END=253 /DNA_ORIENTATION=+
MGVVDGVGEALLGCVVTEGAGETLGCAVIDGASVRGW